MNKTKKETFNTTVDSSLLKKFKLVAVSNDMKLNELLEKAMINIINIYDNKEEENYE